MTKLSQRDRAMADAAADIFMTNASEIAFTKVATLFAAAREEGRQEVLRTIDLDDVGLIIVPRDSPERWRDEGRREELAELQMYQEAALYDACMGGAVFKGWNRSALDRARKVTERRKESAP